MYLARSITSATYGPEGRVLASPALEGGWIDVRLSEQRRLERAGSSPTAARRIAGAVIPGSMAAAIAAGPMFTEAALAALDAPAEDAVLGPDPELGAALDPSGYRDYMIFAGHFSYGYRKQDVPVPDVMYEFPVAYLGNPASFIGPGDEVPWPSYTEWMDYELELGIVVGGTGSDLTPEQATDRIFGFTILNDFSARDIQIKEMTGRLGPCKGKHFACATGPVVATADEVDWRAGLRMQARVNGETICDTNSGEAIWGLDELVAWTSQGERLEAGWLIGSGTCNGGSLIEVDRRLAPGDEVEFEIEGLGSLRNTVGRPATEGWYPDPRPRA